MLMDSTCFVFIIKKMLALSFLNSDYTSAKVLLWSDCSFFFFFFLPVSPVLILYFSSVAIDFFFAFLKSPFLGINITK